MQEVIYVQKKSENTLSTEEIINIFEDTDDLEQIKSAVEKGSERVYVTWATVEMKDKANEVIPINDVIRQQDMLLERGGPIINEHSNKVIGKTLAYKVLEHPKSKSTGVLHLNKIFDMGNKVDDMVWEEIKSGEKKGSSVGGYNMSESIGMDKTTGERAKVLEGFTHMETSAVSDPCNPFATNEAFAVVAKSANSVEKGKGQGKKSEGYINESVHKDINKTESGDPTMENEDVLKSLSEIKESVKAVPGLVENVDKLNKSVSELQKVKKQEEEQEEEKKPEEEKPMDEEKKKACDTKKEDASDEVEGNKGEEVAESPQPERANEQESFKSAVSAEVEKRMAEVQKGLEGRFEKLKGSLTPTPGAISDIQKKAQSMAIDLATGKKASNWQDVHKSVRELNSNVRPFFHEAL